MEREDFIVSDFQKSASTIINYKRVDKSSSITLQEKQKNEDEKEFMIKDSEQNNDLNNNGPSI